MSEIRTKTPRIAVGAAIGVIVFFGIVVVALLEIAGRSSGTTWSRLIYVYAGVEAVAFGAAGLLFGTSIQRSQTVAAEEREESARSSAEQADRRSEEAQRDVLAAKDTLIEGAELVANARALRDAISTQRALHDLSRTSPGAPEARSTGFGPGMSGPSARPVQAPPPVREQGEGGLSGSETAIDPIVYLDELAKRLFGS